MSLHLQRTVETENGVYQPPPVQLEVTLLVLMLLAIFGALLAGKLPPGFALLYLSVLTVPVVMRLLSYRKYGRLGKPSIAIIKGTLLIARPDNTHGALRIAVKDLQELVIYGRVGRRIYRLERNDGTYIETVPTWGQHVEQAAILFLLRALPNKVTVTEPQTLFASIRGDGP